MAVYRQPIVKNSSLKCFGEKRFGKIGQFRQNILSNRMVFYFATMFGAMRGEIVAPIVLLLRGDTTPVYLTKSIPVPSCRRHLYSL